MLGYYATFYQAKKEHVWVTKFDAYTMILRRRAWRGIDLGAKGQRRGRTTVSECATAFY